MSSFRRILLPVAIATGLLASAGAAPALGASQASVVPAGTTDTVTFAPAMGADEINRLQVTIEPGLTDASSDDTVLFVDQQAGAVINAIPPGCVNAGTVMQTDRVRCGVNGRIIGAITIDVGSMNDVVNLTYAPNVDRNIGVTITGGTGNDVLRSNPGVDGVHTLVGGDGDDRLTGGGTLTTMTGGPGADDLRGGPEEDRAVYSEKTTATVLTVGGLNFDDGTGCSLSGAVPGCEGDNLDDNIEDVLGGTGPDVIVGNGLRNDLTGDAGADVLTGGAQGDILNGDAGADVLDGGIGDGEDFLLGGADDDQLTGGDGDDRLDLTGTDAGNDTHSGGAGDDTIVGGAGNDVLRGGPNQDTITGGAGLDTLTYDERVAAQGVRVDLSATPRVAGAETGALDAPVGGSSGGDVVDAAIERVTGGMGDDDLKGNALANVITGNAGDDLLDGGNEDVPASDAQDDLLGGDGRDTADYSARTAAAPQGNLSLSADGVRNDGFPNELDQIGADVEDLLAGSANDTLTGNAAVNRLVGGAGDDTLTGLLASDDLVGEAGVDTATYAERLATESVTAVLGSPDDMTPGTGGQTSIAEVDTLRVENLTGGLGGDDFTGNSGANALRGGGGTDRLVGRLGADLLDGGDQVDEADYSTDGRTAGVTVTLNVGADDGAAGELDDVRTENVTGTALADVLSGDDTVVGNLLVGRAGLDTIDGGAGDDTLRGDDGNDTLNGAGDDDTLDGGGGADAIIGNTGDDLVTYAGRANAVLVDLANAATDQGESCPGAMCEADRISSTEDADGGMGADDLRGSVGANDLRGNGGADTLAGGDGVVADVLAGGDAPAGGAGDTVSYAGRAEPLTVSLVDGATNGAPTENDVLSGLENVVGGLGADTLTGSPAVNRVEGRGGNDTINVRDLVADVADCGADTDSAVVDGLDTATNCETVDRPASPNLTVADATAAEGADASFAVTLSAAATVPVTATFSTADATAVAPGDYTPRTSQTVTFEPGELSKTVAITTVDDQLVEGAETFRLVVASAPGATITDGTGDGSITEGDTFPTLTLPNVSVEEAATATFTATLSRTYPTDLVVRYVASTQSGDTATAGTDYTAATGDVTILAGQTTRTFTVPTLADTAVEPGETFTVTLSDPDAAAAPAFPAAPVTGRGTITDDDTSVAVADAAAVTEGDTGTRNATFTITRTGASTRAVTVDYTTASGTATSGTDFDTAAGVATIPAGGAGTTTVSVPVRGDTTVEPDEDFTLVLSNPTGATVTRGTATGTITNDDTTADPVVPTLSVADAQRQEGNAGTADLPFTLRLSQATTRAVSVDVATGNGSATQPGDYTAFPATKVTFAAGETTKVVPVKVVGDATVEPNETFALALTNPSGLTLARTAAVGTIVNDDQTTTTPPPAKVRPTLTFKTTPARDRKAPYVLTTKGKLGLPGGTPTTACSGGKVSVEIKRGVRRLSIRTVNLTSACAFTSKSTYKTLAANRRGTLKVTARFLGTTRLLRVTRTGAARVG